MKNLVVCLLFALSACSNNAIEKTLRLVSVTQDTKMPPIEYPPEIELHVIDYDIPRDTSKPRIIRNTTQCIEVPASKQDQAFWKRCGLYPPLSNSNIFLGVDQTNWEYMLENWARIKAREEMWRARIDEVNRQRSETTD